MKSMKEKNTKIKEHIDTLSEYLELDRSNVSTVTRSEKSLIFLLNHAKRPSSEVELFETKVNFFKKKSMYVDANLLVHSYVKRHSFDENYVNDYSRIMNPILDVQVKEKTVLLKELEVLFSINKSAVKNNY
jgi:aminoglycoside/choline kinase family phosphotransferase